MRRTVLVLGGFAVVLAALFVAQRAVQQTATAQGQGAAQAPRFEVDPFWPKPLPNHWLLGNAIGVWVDARDQVWIVHRSSATLANNEKALELKEGDCCAGAPPILAYRPPGQSGQELGRGRAGLRLADLQSRDLHRSHRQRVDQRQRARRLAHHEVHAGRQADAQYGKPNARLTGKDAKGQYTVHPRQQRQVEFRPCREDLVDPKANRDLHRRQVFQPARGRARCIDGRDEAVLGAYGKPPDDKVALGICDPAAPPFSPFRNPVHCADLSVDGLVYVCDRVNDRVQVFKPDGTFVQEVFIAKNTKQSGSVWDVAFSRDPPAALLYVVDGMNGRIYILERGRCGSSRASAMAAVSRASSTACIVSPSTRRGTSIRPRPGKGNGSRSS